MDMEMIYQEHSRTVFCYLLALTRICRYGIITTNRKSLYCQGV